MNGIKFLVYGACAQGKAGSQASADERETGPKQLKTRENSFKAAENKRIVKPQKYFKTYNSFQSS